jgi:hypothetical protein
MRREAPRRLHHLVRDPAKEECIGTVENFDGAAMQLFIRGDCTMIAAPVQRDVDGIPKGSHFSRASPAV